MKRVLFLSLILCGSLAMAQNTVDYAELTDTKPHDSEATWNKIAETTQFSWGSTDVRYAKYDIPKPTAKTTTAKANAWKGERVNLQAVVWTKAALNNVRITVSDLKCGSATISAANISPSFVRYIMTDELNKDGKGACGHRENKAEWDSSMVADLLYKPTLQEIKANSTQPVWLTISVPQDAKTGKYIGTLTFSGQGINDMKLNIELNVGKHTLPAPKDWAFHLDLWQNPYSVARYYNVPLWSKAHFDAMRPTMKKLADAGQKVITASIMHKPWNGQTEDYFSSMVIKTKHLDGSWTYDYTVFDKWVEFMMSVGIDKQINCYTLIPWKLTFDYFDQATNEIKFIDTKPGEASYAEYWGGFLKDFAAHLRSKGWFDRTTIAMDERGLEAMREAIKVIRAADKDFKISLAGNYHEEIQSNIYDLCVGMYETFPADVMAARKAEGKVSTVYTCCAEAHPNTFTFSAPAEAASIGWHAAAGKYDGYLRWAYNSWTADPLRDSRFRTWAAGDCYIVYPDYSSIRMERLIEGIQDYEKIRILREEFTAKKATAKLKQLDAIVAPLADNALFSDGKDITTAVGKARKALETLE